MSIYSGWVEVNWSIVLFVDCYVPRHSRTNHSCWCYPLLSLSNEQPVLPNSTNVFAIDRLIVVCEREQYLLESIDWSIILFVDCHVSRHSRKIHSSWSPISWWSRRLLSLSNKPPILPNSTHIFAIDRLIVVCKREQYLRESIDWSIVLFVDCATHLANAIALSQMTYPFSPRVTLCSSFIAIE